MISVSGRHADELRAFIVAALNLDMDGNAIVPTPFTLGDATTPTNVIWSDRDPKRPKNANDQYAMLREVSFIDNGPSETVLVPSGTPGQPDERLDQHYYDVSEWTVSLQVVSRLDTESPTHAANAGAILRRVTKRLESTLTDRMRCFGIAPRRRGQILPLSRIARKSQWETRAAVDLTLSVGSVVVEQQVPFVSTMSGSGTLAGLPSGAGEPGTVPYDATDPDLP